MGDQPALGAVCVEVGGLDERLSLMGSMIEGVMIGGLPRVNLGGEEIREVQSSMKCWRKENSSP